MAASVHEFKARAITGEEIPLDRYKGKALLIVNTASACGYTPQYAGLEALHKKYQDRGFAVLGFPCNQFGKQEPGSEAEIQAFCKKNYGVTFPMFAKVDVNGDQAHPLFDYLKKALPGLLGTEPIKWNFTKFLIDKGGKPIERFAPATKPESIEKEVERLL
ncbi:glutathione peroxidase [Candidatus Manganitrophus noduliformans]|uniref:Glutathione peroxidase n=1 Tax=Candidatus Manganitrophus noduliformans TaxID=2606439 RepID=A0A7X6DLG5_9BACT|nr:glutathione peroxidase [Candidatus Manganitrophus noduliformans]NKE69277.1 glutathione peroxidase [Candidatus Manganitrophus noduliformans]